MRDEHTQCDHLYENKLHSGRSRYLSVLHYSVLQYYYHLPHSPIYERHCNQWKDQDRWGVLHDIEVSWPIYRWSNWYSLLLGNYLFDSNVNIRSN